MAQLSEKKPEPNSLAMVLIIIVLFTAIFGAILSLVYPEFIIRARGHFVSIESADLRTRRIYFVFFRLERDGALADNLSMRAAAARVALPKAGDP